jgi:hypothetical protein
VAAGGGAGVCTAGETGLVARHRSFLLPASCAFGGKTRDAKKRLVRHNYFQDLKEKRVTPTAQIDFRAIPPI